MLPIDRDSKEAYASLKNMRNNEADDKLIATVSRIKTPKIASAEEIEDNFAFAMEFYKMCDKSKDEEDTRRNTEQLASTNQSCGRGMQLKDLIKIHASEIMTKKEGQKSVVTKDWNSDDVMNNTTTVDLNTFVDDINDCDQGIKHTSQKEGSRDDKTKDAQASETIFQSTRKRVRETYNKIENLKKRRTIKIVDNLPTHNKSCQEKNNKLANVRKSLTPNNRFNNGSGHVVLALQATSSSQTVTTKRTIIKHKQKSTKKEFQKSVQQVVTKIDNAVDAYKKNFLPKIPTKKRSSMKKNSSLAATNASDKFSPPIDHKETEDGLDDFAMELDILLEECQNKEDRRKNAKQLPSRAQSCGRGKVLKTLIEVLKPKNQYTDIVPQEKLVPGTEIKEKKSVETKDSNEDDDEANWGLAEPPLDILELTDMLNKTAVVDLSTYFDDINDCDNVDKHTRNDALKSQNQDPHKEYSAKKERNKPAQQSETKEARSCGHNEPSRIVMEKRNICTREKNDKNTTKKEMNKAEVANSIDRQFKSSLKRVHEAYNRVNDLKKQRTVKIIDYLPTDNNIACQQTKNVTDAAFHVRAC